MSTTAYHTAEALAIRLGLPRRYILSLARQGKIPFLDLGRGRLMFDEDAVRDALRKVAEARSDE